MKISIPTFALAVLLAALAVLPYLGLLHGQFLYDDYLVILTNSALWKVKTLADAWAFGLKPSKPVTNFLIATGHLIGDGVYGHRLLTLIIHAATAVSLFVFLTPRLGRGFAWATALCFALSPIHSEIIAVALFRMEAAATLFTLLGWLTAQSLFSRAHSRAITFLHYGSLFLFFGLAQGSKETFGLLYPASLFLLFGREKKRWRFDLFLAGATAFWAGILWTQLARDSASEYPYQDVLGRGLISVADQISLGARSLLEGFYKTFFANTLTSVRLGDRLGPAARWPLALQAGVWLWPLLAFGAFYRRMAEETRTWVAVWLLGVYLYLLIPNTNIGSEHYWYFPSLAFWVLLGRAVQNFFRTRPEANLYATGLLVTMAVLLAQQTHRRTPQLRTRLEFSMADVERFPESAIPWNNVAVAILESRHEQRIEWARPFVERAMALAPNYPNVQLTRFLYEFERGDKKEAGQALREIERIFKNEPLKVERYYRFFGLLQEKKS